MSAPAPSPTGLTAPGRPLAPFRFPAFRAIWTANLASNIGSMIQSVGAAWLMTDLTTSHQLVALVQASTTIPVMLLGLLAGAIADNHDRRIVMLVAQSAMLLASALLALLTFAGKVGPYGLPQAISINTIAFNLARSVGPALGGLLISLTGPGPAFALNALSYLALIVVLLRWHPEQPPRLRRPMLAAIAVGLKFCAGSSPVRRVLVRGFGFGFAAVGYLALAPLLVRQQIGGTEVDYGLLLGAFGLGSILTALWVAPARRRWGSEAVVGAAQLGFALALLPIAAAQSMAPALIGALIAGGGWVATLTTLNVAMQLRSPEEILGRCLAVYQAVTFGAMALGAYAAGLLSDTIGVAGAIRAAAVLLLVLAIALRWLAPMPAHDEGRVLG